jgi:hypothetical protein
MNTRTGKRTARFRVEVVQDGESIEMFFDDDNLSPAPTEGTSHDLY